MSQHLISTKVTEYVCACGIAAINGLDEGLTAKVDARPLSPAEEIEALIAGRRTYTLSYSRYLIHRTPGRIRFGDLKGTVHAQHLCAAYKQPTLIGAA